MEMKPEAHDESSKITVKTWGGDIVDKQLAMYSRNFFALAVDGTDRL
jgi:hypothetical protein